MSRAAQARALDEQQRQAQVAIKAAFLAQFVQSWDVLDWQRIDLTTPTWLRVVMGLVRPWRRASADLALRYYRDRRLLAAPRPLEPAPTIRFVDAPEELPGPVRLGSGRNSRITLPARVTLPAGNGTAGGLNLGSVHVDRSQEPVIDWSSFDRAAEHALTVTGPSELKRQAAMGRTERQARDRALVTASGAASRQVLNGGRAATLTAVGSDDQAIGWARLTDGDPCAFCALLAGRGFVYKSEASAGFQPHDGCSCVPVPGFSKSEPWPGNARAYRRLYNDSAKGYSGRDARNAFRRAYEQQRREAAQPSQQPMTA